MTDEFKQKLLAYLTGKLKKETGVNEPIYSNIQRTNVGIQTYLNELGIYQPILWEIIQGKNANIKSSGLILSNKLGLPSYASSICLNRSTTWSVCPKLSCMS